MVRTTTTTPESRQPGISWVELAVNFLIVTQHSIPVNVAGHGPSDHRCSEDMPQLDLQAYSFSNVTNAFCNSVAHLQYLVDSPVYPPQTTQHVKSLSLLAAGVFKKGFPRRPQLELQADTIQTVLDYCLRYQDDGKTKFDIQPTIPARSAVVTTNIANPMADSLQDRMTRYHQFRSRLRNTRRPQRETG